MIIWCEEMVSLFSSAYARAMVKVPFTLFIFPLKYYSIFPSRNNTSFRSPFTGWSFPNGRHKILKLMDKKTYEYNFSQLPASESLASNAWDKFCFFFSFVKEIGWLFADYLILFVHHHECIRLYAEMQFKELFGSCNKQSERNIVINECGNYYYSLRYFSQFFSLDYRGMNCEMDCRLQRAKNPRATWKETTLLTQCQVNIRHNTLPMLLYL